MGDRRVTVPNMQKKLSIYGEEFLSHGFLCFLSQYVHLVSKNWVKRILDIFINQKHNKTLNRLFKAKTGTNPCITNVTSFTSVTWWTFPSSRTAFIACASHVIAHAVVSAVIGTSLNAVHTVPSIIAFCCLRKWKRDSTAYVIFYVLFCFEIHHDFNTNNLNFVITSNIK